VGWLPAVPTCHPEHVPLLIALPSNRPPARFYRGGTRITGFRGEPDAGTNEPEDWVASATTLAGEQSLGLTTLPDGRVLAEAIREDPEYWLGPDHAAVFGDDPLLLVKLLDAGQRLPVHAHPDDEFAAREIGRAHGKTEAWFILEGGSVHVGLKRQVSPDELARLVAEQDTRALLGLLHERRVEPGDTVLVPAGMLHAVGDGILLLELQQPEDLSILLEWSGFDIDGATYGHLGLGFDRALGAVELRARTEAEIDALTTHRASGASVLVKAADTFFRLERHVVGAEPTPLDAGFAIIVVAEGEVRLAVDGEELVARRGSTVLIPHAAGGIGASGAGELLVCRPPHPHAS